MDEWERSSNERRAMEIESRITELVGLGALALEGVGEEISVQLRGTVSSYVEEVRTRVGADVDREVARARAEVAALMASVDQVLATWHDRLAVSGASLEDAVATLATHLGQPDTRAGNDLGSHNLGVKW
jgi:hypothetical protein